MSNLVLVNNSISVRQKRIELSMLLNKIIIKISRDEFDVLEQLIMLWINSKKCETFKDKALYVFVFVNIYRTRIMPHILRVSSRVTMNLTIPEAFSLNRVLGDIDLNNCPYEQALSDRIMSEINRQTV